ncbi:dephospho-CoA kinase [Rubrolithibacter danxiaensis]|uniref:dephospho-CoA kinase n=1 Tax=Rubrolithibacter danxiaensis TaxID=3390805 RepID=UPI003BF83997
MLKIGITGGIGSGKTVVCRVFELLGIPVFYADTVAKEVMQTDSLLIRELIETFGPETYFPEGVLNRKYLANIVFRDEAELKKLNSLVHPAVFRAFDYWTEQQKNVPYVLKEAALLFESGSYKKCDYTILVTSPIQLRIKRIIDRDSISIEQVQERINKQMSDDEKKNRADCFIKNDEAELIIPQVLALHEKFSAASRHSQ